MFASVFPKCFGAHQTTKQLAFSPGAASRYLRLASRISELHYADGLTPAEVEQLAVEFPVERFWWAMWIDA